MPQVTGSVRADEVLTLAELRRRLGWGEHAVRMARRGGLRMIVFGRNKYVLGVDLLAFFERLGADGDLPHTGSAAGRRVGGDGPCTLE